MRSFLVMIPLLALISAGPALAQGAPAIHGEISLAKSVSAKIAPEAALYVIARPAGQTQGMPLAVKRFPAPLSFPLRFELNAADVMTGAQAFQGKLTLTARVAQQGSATPARSGDLEASRTVDAEVGGKATAQLTLDRVRK
jgi:hypothetical protein